LFQSDSDLVSLLATPTSASQAAAMAGQDNGEYVPAHYPPLSPRHWQGEQLGWKLKGIDERG